MSGEDNSAKTDQAKNDGGSETLKIWLSVVTPIITAVFGFFIWNAQSAIQDRVEINNALLDQQNKMQLAQHQSQLALKEAFYKRRLEVYERACEQIVETERSLADVDVTGETMKKATDAVSALHKFRKGNQLYWSAKLDQRLAELWELGIRKLRPAEGPDGEQLNEEISKEITELHAQMKQDLEVELLARAIQDTGKSAQEAEGGSPEPK